MPVIPAGEAAVHELHGASFASYATPARGSKELCAHPDAGQLRTDVPAGASKSPLASRFAITDQPPD